MGLKEELQELRSQESEWDCRPKNMLPPSLPRFTHILISGTCKCYLICKGVNIVAYGKDVSAKDLERRSLPWIIQVSPRCNHVHPYKRGRGVLDIEEKRNMQKSQHEDGCRDWNGAATSQGTPGNTGSHQSRKRQGTDPPPSPSASGGSTSLLTS